MLEMCQERPISVDAVFVDSDLPYACRRFLHVWHDQAIERGSEWLCNENAFEVLRSAIQARENLHTGDDKSPGVTREVELNDTGLRMAILFRQWVFL